MPWHLQLYLPRSHLAHIPHNLPAGKQQGGDSGRVLCYKLSYSCKASRHSLIPTLLACKQQERPEIGKPLCNKPLTPQG